MNLDLQFKIKNNPNLQRYLRENSNWYKYLNRNPESLNAFTEEMKERYKLRPGDKINNLVDKLDLISSFINVLK
ncbi:MAG: hypothetical protein E7166_05930 [Firmicutes bacterium]|nr:hypothetical protein [Bacillota bacterium]